MAQIRVRPAESAHVSRNPHGWSMPRLLRLVSMPNAARLHPEARSRINSVDQLTTASLHP